MATLINTFNAPGLFGFIARMIFAFGKFAFKAAFTIAKLTLKVTAILLVFAIVGQLERGPVD